MNYQMILNKIKESYIDILGNNLIGIYVHGSIAFNCFNWDKSDIDFIVVVDKALNFETKLELMKSTIELNKIAPQKGLEMSVILKKYCLNFKHPTPYELHFSNTHLNWFNNNPLEYCEKMNGDDRDLAAHFTIIKSVGIVLYGEDINNIFGDISNDYYIDSIKYDIENANDEIIKNPVYIVLNLCRVLAFLNDGLILSKEKGGQWGLINLPKKYHNLISAMLDNYIKGTIFYKDEPFQIEFCEYMLDLIFNTTV